jgi:Ca2+:H+ antiporter
MGLLALSSTALVLPTPFAEYYVIEDEHVLAVSRFAAVFLMAMYLQLLIFQLRTHAALFEDGGEEEELPRIPLSVALLSLFFVTLLVAVFSDFLVASIDGFTTESGISRTFVGLILIPIVGNAVEHMTAVTVAMKDKMDLAMGIAVGSCTQVALFVIPLTVLVGWACGKDMTLNFPVFEIMLYILSVVTVFICLSNPKGNWLEGSLLITTYVMIGVGFWFEKVVNY